MWLADCGGDKVTAGRTPNYPVHKTGKSSPEPICPEEVVNQKMSGNIRLSASEGGGQQEKQVIKE